jgi:hypothetical protein
VKQLGADQKSNLQIKYQMKTQKREPRRLRKGGGEIDIITLYIRIHARLHVSIYCVL